MRSRKRLLRLTRAIGASAAALVYAAYRNDIKAAGERLKRDRQVIQSPNGPIEFAESGGGPPVLVIHGAGGGFDQGLDLGRAFLGENFRVIAPSRFGYLGTPVPDDISAEAQADAYVRVLDALHLDRVPIVGVSAGAPSTIQFCVRHPERCTALVLLVPMAYAPGRPSIPTRSAFVTMMVNAISTSDFVFWAATKVAHSALLKTILGTPVQTYVSATKDERRSVDEFLRSILPVSRRAAGLANDGVLASTLTRYPLEDIRVPALVISTPDDLYGTYESSRYTAGQIPGGRFISFPAGGHLLVGHDAEVRSHVAGFLKEALDQKQSAAIA